MGLPRLVRRDTDMVETADVLTLAPLIVLALVAVTLILLEVFAATLTRTMAVPVTVFACLTATGLALSSLGDPTRAVFAGALVDDDLSRASTTLFMVAGALSALLSPIYTRNARMESGEYYALLLIAITGMQVMVMAADFMTFFLGLETMSIAVYALTAMRANDGRAPEAALKYFLVGAFSTGFLLFGIALVYGAAADVGYQSLARAGDSFGLLGLGLALILVGFGFKVAAVPFHMWAPDVYEGAPTPVTGFMAVTVKAAAFLSLVRITVVGIAPSVAPDFAVAILSFLAVATVLAGNALALVQPTIKRMLAYSSVSHAGYLLIGIVAASKGESTAIDGVLFYLTAYTFMTLGAFGVLTYLERKEGGVGPERFEAFEGLGFRHPWLGLAMTVFMVALAGMPPTGGFFGKLYVFSAALRAGEVTLAIVGIVGSIIGVFYYLRVVVAFFMRAESESGPLAGPNPSVSVNIALTTAFVLTLGLGVLPNLWVGVGQDARRALEAQVRGGPPAVVNPQQR